MAIGNVHRTEFKPNPVQGNFIESRAKADLFSSRMGEGKSTALAWAALYHTRHNPGASWVIIRDTFENIVGTTQKTFFQWFPPGIFGEYNATRKTFKWASGVADGDVTFMGLDDQQDASKLMSREIAGFGIDEPAPAVGSAGVDEFIFDMAMSRLRQPGMSWYAAKLAENNPDEGHWTYRKFVAPDTADFMLWQPQIPENVLHLPPNYYETLRGTWASRPDLLRRFVEGEFGFQQIGKSVTPQWNEKLHLALQLAPLPRTELVLCWDFGLNPTCAITQRTPLGHWNILDAMVGEGIGTQELIHDWVKPLLVSRYKPLNCPMRHVGDPAGNNREQSSAERSAVRVIRQELGGSWKSGPVKIEERLEPLRAVLTRTVGGRGLVQVDRERAACVWHALRGGWHYHVARTGITSGIPAKGPGPHSHIGDALAYGAAILFPMGRLQKSGFSGLLDGKAGSGYFGGPSSSRAPARGLERKPGLVPASPPPEHGATL